jgi:hypothetical protein
MQGWAKTGTIYGRVLGAGIEKPLSNASVRVQGTLLASTTDYTGTFRIAPVPTGTQKLEVSYLGYITTVIDWRR